MSFQLFKPTYTNRQTSERCQSPTFNIRFRDHLKRRQTLAGHEDEAKARRIAERVMELVECRRERAGLTSKLRQWVETRRPSFRKRLISLDLITAQSVATTRP